MSEQKQLFSANLAKDAVYKTGLRSFMEYRDLGIENATHGKFRAHIIRIKKDAAGNHDLHTTGLHQHKCDFQMFYVLNGWIKFIYEGHGEHTFTHGRLRPAAAGHRAQRARLLRRPRGPRDLLAGRARDRGGRPDAGGRRRGALSALATTADRCRKYFGCTAAPTASRTSPRWRWTMKPFSDVEGAHGEGTPMQSASGISFRVSPPGYVLSWHCAPRRQYSISLSGRPRSRSATARSRGSAPATSCWPRT